IERDLLDAIEEALASSSERANRAQERAEVCRRIECLTPRQLQVMRLVIRGMLNKQIAAALHIAEKTVKVHRSRMMQVMQVDSVAELVRLAAKAEPGLESSVAVGAACHS
ncbi:LuxR C-terminal-related transcriptional regulator, partial [bacterium]|nr:LuxR C-terminal-related transcriptional regulator [bacterium]